jgi:prophage maintenance system killer protein
VQRALERAQAEADPIDAAAALLYEIVAAQGFFEGNKRTAVIIARWFIRQNMDLDPDELIHPDDRELGALLVRTAGGDRNEAAIQALLRDRTGAPD